MPISYVKDMMDGVAADGLDDELRQLAEDDAKLLGQLGVSDERERNLAFYLDHFLDELCVEQGMPTPPDRQAVVAAAFSDLRGGADIGLAEIRSALYRAMGGKRRKTAYPNTAGVMETNIKPQRDVGKWVRTLGEIHAAGHSGENKESALRRLTEEWDSVEKLDFQQWLRYYERGDHEKYAAVAQEPAVQPALQLGEQPTQQSPLSTRRSPPRAETRSVADNQRALIGRLDAAKRLLRYLQPAWPAARWNSIYEALSHLEQEIVSLRTASSMRDRIVRTAGIWAKAGFRDGADILFKIAQPPGEDVASQIEKALTGREYSTKPGGEAAPPGGADMPPPLPPSPEAGAGALPPPPGGEAGAAPPLPEGMPPEAAGALPEPPPPPPAPEEKSKPDKDENPYAGSTAKDILEILEPLMRRFKEREIVRQLSKVDMMMDALNIVSYFPELGEAIGRLIETDSYVGTRLEKIIGKLRGGLREDSGKDEKPQPPSVEMGPPEETAVTVGEQPPAPPAAPPPAPPAEETAVKVEEGTPAPPAPPPAAPGA